MSKLRSGRGIAVAATTALISTYWTVLPSHADATLRVEQTEQTQLIQAVPAEKVLDPDAWHAGTALSLPGKGAFISWIDPDTKPWASVLAIHGLGFHKESFKELGARMARLGVAVYALDVRGFGSYHEADPNARVDYEQTFRDIQEALTLMRKSNPEIPVYMMGESMGGAIALQSTARYPELVDGAITSVPAFSVMRNLPEAFKIAGIALTQGMDGEVSLKSAVVDRATVKNGVKREVLNDPGTRRYLTVRDMIAYRKLMHQNGKAVKRLTTTPVLLVQGFKDRLVGPRATTKMFNHVSTAFKELNMTGNAEHLVFEENQFTDATIDSLISWMNEHGYGGTPFAMLPSQISRLPGSSGTLANGAARPGSIAMPIEQNLGLYKELRIARGYYSRNDLVNARKHTELAIKAGQADPVALRSQLATMPAEVVVSNATMSASGIKTGPESGAIARHYHIGKRFGTVDRPSILVFFSPESTITKEQEVLERGIQKLGHKVNCLKQNIVDPEVKEMAASFGVQSFPTALVFDRNLEVIAHVEASTDVELMTNNLKHAVDASAHSKKREAATALSSADAN